MEAETEMTASAEHAISRGLSAREHFNFYLDEADAKQELNGLLMASESMCT